MVRTAALLLLLGAGVAAEDPREEKWKQYHRDYLRGLSTIRESGQRLVLVRGCKTHDTAGAAGWLIGTALRDKAGDVVREAVRVLSKYKNPASTQAMVEAWQKKLKKSWEGRALVLLALAKTRTDGSDKVLAAAFKDKDARVVVAACKSVGLSNRLAFKPHLVRQLKHKHPAVRGAATGALARLRADETLPQLFHMFCKDKSARARYDAWVALKKLALEKDLPCDPAAWRDWWQDQVGSLQEGEPNPWGRSFPAKGTSRPAYLFRIPILSSRICFVIDASTSMDDAWRIDHKTERKKKKEERIPNFFGVKTRWDLVTNHIKACLGRLPDKTEVCFSFFNFKLAQHPERGRFIKLTRKSRAAIMEHLKGVKRSGGSMTYEALQVGWGWLKEGHPGANFKKGVDMMVLITDSEVKDGELKNRADRLVDEVWRASVTRNLVVHAIGLYNHDFALCAGIAEACNGLYVHAQPFGDTAEPQDLEFWPAKKKAFEEARKKRKAG